MIIMGRSVIKGATATLKPSFLLCLNVSDMTSVSRGPGDIPAVSPKKAPIVKNDNEEAAIMYFLVLFSIRQRPNTPHLINQKPVTFSTNAKNSIYLLRYSCLDYSRNNHSCV